MTDDAWSRFPNSPVGEGWVWYVSRVETEVAMSWLLIEAKRWGHGGKAEGRIGGKKKRLTFILQLIRNRYNVKHPYLLTPNNSHGQSSEVGIISILLMNGYHTMSLKRK